MARSIERRMAVAPVEVRESDGAVTVVGYASTFNQPYDMGWYRETVAPGAFKRSLGRSPDVRLLVNHDGLPLARTTSGTLSLREDETGLMVEARLDPSDPDVAALLPKMRRGDLNQMSFGFRMADDGDEWSKDMSSRTLRNLDINDGDVSVVTYPANPNARVGLRDAAVAVGDSLASALRHMEVRGASQGEVADILRRALSFLGTDSVDVPIDSDEPAPVVEPSRAAQIAAEQRDRVLRSL